MKFWYDTEFLEDGETIAPISIGMVAEDGREYYAVNANAPWGRIRQHDWLMENVVPHLPLIPTSRRQAGLITPSRPIWIDFQHPHVKPTATIAHEVRDFLQESADEPIELWGYFSSYDHILLSQLWGRMIDRPDGIPMWTNDIQQEAARLGLNGRLPTQGDDLHNALADARWTRDAWQYLADHEGK